MTQAELVARGERVLMSNCRRQPLVLTRGEGAKVWDADGRCYYDLIGGVAVNAFGHAPAFLFRALSAQAERLLHVSNLFYSEQQILAAERLTKAAGMDRVFFCNSGAEAVEAAIKLARKYGHGRRFGIIAAQGSFHGRTMGALAATGQLKYQGDFAPMLTGFSHAPFNDLAAWIAAVTPQTCALLVELIQGEGGVYPADPEFIRGLDALAHEHGLLLIFDEVQTGFGRTGRMFAWEHYGVKPDIMTAAKGLGGGFPLGAMMAQEHASVFEPGDHQSTFGGNPLAAAAVSACLDELMSERLPERAAALGPRIREIITGWGMGEKIKEIRGMGLLIGLEVAGAPAYVGIALEHGLLLNAVNDHTLRFAPPLNISEEDLEASLAILREVLAG